jgi:hypothetical protein
MSRSALGVLAIVLALTPQLEIRAQEKSGASAPVPFTALDYIQIQQLVALYAQYIDTCSNNGYDYADLFAADGYFAPFTNGRVGGKWQGRERLAEASGGGRLGCKDVRWIKEGVHHMYVNHIIKPTPEGATGTVNMLMIGLDGDPNKIEHDGFYEDTYVKTPQGWRFQSRIHHALRPPRPRARGRSPGSRGDGAGSGTLSH